MWVLGIWRMGTMKDTNQLLTNIVNQQTTRETLAVIPAQASPQDGDGDLQEMLLNDLFIFLKGQYGSFDAKLRKPGIEASLKREWSRTLVANNVTSMEQINRGKETIRVTPGAWCPSITDFCELCNITSDMPTPAEAWAEVSRYCHTVHDDEIYGNDDNRKWVIRSDHNWESPAMFEAGKRCGFKSILQGQVGEDQFKDFYKKVCKEVMGGKTFETPIHETKNRLTVGAKKEKRTKTEQNKSAAAKAMQGMGF